MIVRGGIPYRYTNVLRWRMSQHDSPPGGELSRQGNGRRHPAERSSQERAPTPLAEQAVVALRRHILSFALRPGEILAERRLERLLSVSRSPVREALARLAREGLVRREGRSYRVAPIDVAELEQLFAFRILLETAAVRWAAESASSEDLLALDAIVAELEKDLSPEGRLDVTTRLHLGLARASGNRFVADALASLFPRVTRARYLELASPRAVEQADDEHRRLVALVREHRGEEAAATIAAHLERTRTHLLDSLHAQVGVRAMIAEALP